MGLTEMDEVRVFSARTMLEELCNSVLLPDSFGRKTQRSLFYISPIAMSIGNFIPKGMQIATVANLATGSHLHFGLRIGTYASAFLNGTPFAGTGGLPQNNCPDNPPNDKWYPAFPAGFISPEITSNVLFQ